jgi:hypothetical protein
VTEGTERRQHIQDLSPGTLALLRDLAEATSEKTVRNFATVIGVPKDPIEAQEMMAALRKIAKRLDDPEVIADTDWTRRTRRRTEGAFGKAVAAAITVAVIGGLHALVAGTRALLPAAAILAVLATPAGL